MVKKIIFLFLIAVGIFLRVYHLQSVPGGLFMDEISMAVDIKTLVENGTDQYGNRMPFTFEDVTDYKLPVYIYLSALVYKMLGPQLITIRIVALVSSLISIFLLGYLIKILFPEKKELSFYAMVALALSPFAIHFSRIAYETTLATCFLMLFLIAIIKVLRKQNTRVWFLAGTIAAILATWAYPAPRFIIPVFIFFLFGISFLVRFKNIEQTWMKKITFGFLALIVISFIPPILLSPVANKRSLNYLLEDAQGSGITLFITKASSVLSSWLDSWNLEFLFDKGDVFAYRHGTKENGIFLSIFFIPYLIGIWYIVKNFFVNNFSLFFLVLFAIIAGLPSALTSGTPYATRIVPMFIPFTIIIAFGIDYLLVFLKKQKMHIRLFTYTTITMLLLYQIALFMHIYFVHFEQTSQPEFPQATSALGTYTKQARMHDPKKTIYFLNEKTCHNWGFDALYLWYFANLPNKPMIRWNNLYRTARYNASHMSPFDAFDQIIIPTGHIENIILFPGQERPETRGLFVRCGYHFEHIDRKHETIKKVFYMYEDEQREPFYVVSEKI